MEQLECLAQWKDGSLRYLMRYWAVYSTKAPLVTRTATSFTIKFNRCRRPPLCRRFYFLQRLHLLWRTDRHNFQPAFLLAQSGDATCSGLTSPTYEGSRTLKLTPKVCDRLDNARLSKWKWMWRKRSMCFFWMISGESDSRKCHYPSWFLAHNRWQTLDGRWSCNPHKNTTLRIINIAANGTVSSLAGPYFSNGGSTELLLLFPQKNWFVNSHVFIWKFLIFFFHSERPRP